MRIVSEAARVFGTPLAVLQVNLSQGFDRVDHGYLHAVLKLMGLATYLTKLVDICYRELTTCLLINGRTTEKISVN